MNLPEDTLLHLINHGWRPTINPNEMLKLYDGYVATLQYAEYQEPRWLWSVWLTDSLPVRFGACAFPVRASNQCDRAVLDLYDLAG
jgi:hypothetical protein